MFQGFSDILSVLDVLIFPGCSTLWYEGKSLPLCLAAESLWSVKNQAYPTHVGSLHLLSHFYTEITQNLSSDRPPVCVRTIWHRGAIDCHRLCDIHDAPRKRRIGIRPPPSCHRCFSSSAWRGRTVGCLCFYNLLVIGCTCSMSWVGSSWGGVRPVLLHLLPCQRWKDKCALHCSCVFSASCSVSSLAFSVERTGTNVVGTLCSSNLQNIYLSPLSPRCSQSSRS